MIPQWFGLRCRFLVTRRVTLSATTDSLFAREVKTSAKGASFANVSPAFHWCVHDLGTTNLHVFVPYSNVCELVRYGLSIPRDKILPLLVLIILGLVLPTFVCSAREKSLILSMINISGADEEAISLSKAVKATGNIEDWLGALEKGMQVKPSYDRCPSGAVVMFRGK